MTQYTAQGDDQNSARTRVRPAFMWFRDHGELSWPTAFLNLAEGITVTRDLGPVLSVDFEKERTVPPSPVRLAWMIRNAHRLVPQDGRQWRQYASRVIDNPEKERALDLLEAGITVGFPRELVLEGATHADCLIECARAIVWIEGKRNDWLSPCTTWDVTRDQLARNLEAAWIIATERKKDFWLVICHEHELKHHEVALVEGYRNGTWSAGWPHLSTATRSLFRAKIGTLRWKTILRNWPGLLGDLAPKQQ